MKKQNGLFRLTAQDADSTGRSDKIRSFEIVTLRMSGMRFTTEYEIVMRGEGAEVTEYAIRYENHAEVRVPVRSAVCGETQALQLLHDCRLLSWDGFHGAHPKHVRDGIMFRLTATVNGGRTIHADGSENFPKHYRDFTDGLNALLRAEND